MELGGGALLGMWGRGQNLRVQLLLKQLPANPFKKKNFISSHSCSIPLVQSNSVLPITCLLRILRCTLFVLSVPCCWPGIWLSLVCRINGYLSVGFQASRIMLLCVFLPIFFLLIFKTFFYCSLVAFQVYDWDDCVHFVDLIQKLSPSFSFVASTHSLYLKYDRLWETFPNHPV